MTKTVSYFKQHDINILIERVEMYGIEKGTRKSNKILAELVDEIENVLVNILGLQDYENGSVELVLNNYIDIVNIITKYNYC